MITPTGVAAVGEFHEPASMVCEHRYPERLSVMKSEPDVRFFPAGVTCIFTNPVGQTRTVYPPPALTIGGCLLWIFGIGGVVLAVAGEARKEDLLPRRSS
ncbi:hypothetical protein DDQ50_05250 [Amnibacterium flavum]|uniref:Uncharacterized protein n=1 Tax=Amnibacterium flavum TaxID=2173173 RepID=A0A2V1HVT1_9MICO|nr:hypothetical protein DDQ50_05250 [Amnibacterium flavum]